VQHAKFAFTSGLAFLARHVYDHFDNRTAMTVGKALCSNLMRR
jgi:hypothetical protein